MTFGICPCSKSGLSLFQYQYIGTIGSHTLYVQGFYNSVLFILYVAVLFRICEFQNYSLKNMKSKKVSESAKKDSYAAVMCSLLNRQLEMHVGQ